MKIEDINYDLPTAEISAKDFDVEIWRKKNPIDYFKYVFILFKAIDKIPTNIPRDLAMETAFGALYTVLRLYIPDTLYKFYSLNEDKALNNKKFDTLQRKQIYLSKIKDFNDPFDSKAFFYDPSALSHINGLEHVNGRLIEDFSAFHIGTALTSNNANCLPMWAHYSNNHQGFCVSYDMKAPENITLSGLTFQMQYTDERLDITSFMKKYAEMISSTVENCMARGIKKIPMQDVSIVYVSNLLGNIKHSSWKYENEFRCTMGVEPQKSPYVDATPKAIYIGMKCSEENKRSLLSIAKKLSIPAYQMKFDELSDAFELREEKIEV